VPAKSLIANNFCALWLVLGSMYFNLRGNFMSGKKLYVGNLPYSVEDADLKEFFEKAGTVESARVIMDRESGRSKGFGFVEFSTGEEAEQAIKDFHEKPFEGSDRPLIVNEAKPMEKREDRPRTGGYEKRSGGGSYDNKRSGGGFREKTSGSFDRDRDNRGGSR